MNQSIVTEPAAPADAQELTARYREMKHGINNTLGVMMALAELSEINPDNYQKLNDVIMERVPKMVTELREFGDDLNRICAAIPPEELGED